MELRDYQEECVQLIMSAYQENPTSTELVVWATGSGKTVMFNEIIRQFSSQGKPALILAHRDELLNQAAEKYRAIKPDAIIGKVGSGIHEYGGEVTVASVATISRPYHLKQLGNFHYGLLITDEAHHSQADSYQKIYKALQGTVFHLMVTATPDRLDGKPILNKPPIHERDIIQQVEAGWLVSPRAIAIKTHISLDNVGTRMGDFAEGELEKAIDTHARNKRVVEAYQEHAQGRRAACFAVTVNHAESLAYTFNDHGIAAGVISGETPLDVRKMLYSQFHSGEVKVLVSVNVLSEGWDEPLCDCIIMARPTKSRSLYVQAIGRGLRLAPDKQDCIILDLTDNVLKHRISPQNLSKALEIELLDGETIEEAKERKKREEEARKKQIRKLKEQRDKDMQIDLLQRLEWTLLVNGVYMMQVGERQHRLCLEPQWEESEPGYDDDDAGGKSYLAGYRVVAMLEPKREKQFWTTTLPLADAQMFAEREARKIVAQEKAGNGRNAAILVDRNAPWRQRPATPQQKDALSKMHVTFYSDITNGEASDLLTEAYSQHPKRNRKAIEV